MRFMLVFHNLRCFVTMLVFPGVYTFGGLNLSTLDHVDINLFEIYNVSSGVAGAVIQTVL